MSNPGPAITVTNHPQRLGLNQNFRLVASLKSMPLTQVQDVPVPILNCNNWFAGYIIYTNASRSFNSTGAAASVWTGPGATGTHLFGSTALGGLVDPRDARIFNSNGSGPLSVQKLYFRSDFATNLPNMTVDVFIYAFDLEFLP